MIEELIEVIYDGLDFFVFIFLEFDIMRFMDDVVRNVRFGDEIFELLEVVFLY